MFPTIAVPNPLAELVIERANIAPGSTGITVGFEEGVEEPERLLLSVVLPPEGTDSLGICIADL